MTSFPLPVIRRVGGLEVKREGEKALRDVIRRVGGLEVNTPPRGEA